MKGGSVLVAWTPDVELKRHARTRGMASDAAASRSETGSTDLPRACARLNASVIAGEFFRDLLFYPREIGFLSHDIKRDTGYLWDLAASFRSIRPARFPE